MIIADIRKISTQDRRMRLFIAIARQDVGQKKESQMIRERDRNWNAPK